MIYKFYVSGSLIYLNEATLLHKIKFRYNKDRIYVSILSVVYDFGDNYFTCYHLFF